LGGKKGKRGGAGRKGGKASLVDEEGGEGVENEKKIAEYKNIVLVVGSEGAGMRNLVKKNCDLLVRIDTNKEVESLNVSVATAIALNEIYRNKNV
jgi:tRNA G18 (ribose-2'-O)-methylase SpoU